MAFAIPPPASPTGCGILVKKSQLSACNPRDTTKNRMNASGVRATTTEAAHRPTAIRDVVRRRHVRVMRRPPQPAPVRRPCVGRLDRWPCSK